MTSSKDQSSKEELAVSFALAIKHKPCSYYAKEFFIAGYSTCESQLTELREENEKLREALFLIRDPIPCPACSMSTGEDTSGIPCYCFDTINDPRNIAAEALTRSDSKETK